MNNNDYTADVITNYNDDYQREEYYGIVKDKDGNVIEKSSTIQMSKDDAYTDALQIIEKKCKSSSFINNKEIRDIPNKKIWLNNGKTYLTILLYTLIAIGIWIIGLIIWGNFGMFIPIIYIFLLPFVLIFSKNKQIINFGSYIYDNDKLYVVMFNNDNSSLAMTLSNMGFSLAGLAVAAEGIKNNQNYLEQADSISDILRLSKSPEIYKFNSVSKINKINDNCYRITANYTNHKNGKNSTITFNLKNKFPDFNELILCFESLQNK